MPKEFCINSSGICNGTLFRFPLRTSISKLSKVCYCGQRLETLINTFVNEGYLNILFLKKVQSIKLYKRNRGSDNLEELYSIEVSEECIRENYLKRNEFLESIKRSVCAVNYERLTLDYCLEVEENAQGRKSNIKYFISELFGYSNQDVFLDMIKDPDLSYIPLVSVALPVEGSDPGGHVFCGLPLPMQEKCMTGMPLHVNGFFALGPDRKDLKWKTVSASKSNDKSVLWNECLIEKLLPVVYSNLLSYLISNNNHCNIIYKAWPDKECVNTKWKSFLPYFCEKMSLIPCVFIESKSKWMTYGDVVFIEEHTFKSKEQFKAVHNLLQIMGKNVTCVAEHIIHSFKCSVNKVTKVTVQLALKDDPSQYTRIPDKDHQLLVLKFILSCYDDMRELCELQLLPLENGGYGEIQLPDKHNLIYIPTDIHPKDLLPSHDSVLNLPFFSGHTDMVDLLQTIALTGNFI